MGIAVPGSIGIRLRLLSGLQSDDLRGDSNKTLADAPNPLFIRITEGTNWR
jgi:hypothetical protein